MPVAGPPRQSDKVHDKSWYSCWRAVCSSRMNKTWAVSASGSSIRQALGFTQLGSGSSEDKPSVAKKSGSNAVQDMIGGQFVNDKKGWRQVDAKKGDRPTEGVLARGS